MLVKRAFFARGEPSNVIRDLWVIDENVPHFIAWKNAENNVGQCLDAMRHRISERGLQPHEITGQRIIDDLTPAVLEGPVAERPTRKNREEMCALCVFRQDRRAGRDNELAGLEVLQKIDVGGSLLENFERP